MKPFNCFIQPQSSSLKTALFCLFFLLFAPSLLKGEMWTTPVSLSDPGANAIQPKVDINDSGHMVCVWKRAGIVQATTATFGGSWSAKTDLQSEFSETVSFPTVKINNAGQAIAVWGGDFLIAPFGGIFTSYLQFGNEWATPIAALLAQNETNSQLALNNSGQASIVVENAAVANQIDEMEASFGGPWTPSTILSEANGLAQQAFVDINDDGFLITAWRQQVGLDTIIYTDRAIFGGGWSTTFPVCGRPLSASGEDANNPRISLNNAGQAVAIWQRFDGFNDIIQASTLRRGSRWSTPTDLSVSGRNANNPAVAINASGQIVAVWRRFNGSKFILQAATKPFAGAWSSPVNLSAPLQDATNPIVALNDAGQAVAGWVRSDGSNDIFQAATLNFGLNWSTPVNVSETGKNANVPKVAINSEGQVVAVWVKPGPSALVMAATTSVAPVPPANVLGVQISISSSGGDITYTNRISWDASPSSNVSYYNIYREGLLVFTISNTQSSYFYEDGNQAQGVPVNYEVSAVSTGNAESTKVSINVP